MDVIRVQLFPEKGWLGKLHLEGENFRANSGGGGEFSGFLYLFFWVFFVCLFFVFWPHSRHMKFPRPWDGIRATATTYPIAVATLDP